MSVPLKDGYYEDPSGQRHIDSAMSSRADRILERWNAPLTATHPVVEERGLCLVRIPKTGTQTFERLCLEAFSSRPSGRKLNRRTRYALTNRLCWQLWPNLHMAARIAGESPWVVGGRSFGPEQLSLLRDFWHRTAASDERIEKPAFKLSLTHWPWHFDPELFSRVMVSDDPHYVTILRDPIERCLSSYLYDRSRSYASGEPSIEEFDRFVSERYDPDFYCRWFASPDDPDYSRAERTLTDVIDTVGITEHYDRFMKLCHVRFGVPGRPLNVNAQRKPFGVADLPEPVMRRLQSVTERDRHLYDVAMARFTTDCAAAGL